MSLFPEGFDPRGEVVFILDLVNINTVDGDFGFILGADGAFTDVNGKRWIGSTLLQGSDDELAIGGAAPSGSLSLSFFQDPSEPDVIQQMKDLGVAYVEDRPVTFHVQPLRSQAEFYAPVLAPIKVMTRTARRLAFGISGPLERSIVLSYESVFERRRQRRGLVYNTTDHAALTGAANPSLRYMPTTTYQEQKLFG